jgi:hypothetical protein
MSKVFNKSPTAYEYFITGVKLMWISFKEEEKKSTKIALEVCFENQKRREEISINFHRFLHRYTDTSERFVFDQRNVKILSENERDLMAIN